ncbi:hypothetical protein PMG11_01924 [Penicillium brasilianum]|uniref:Ankyrin repeat protein n=1 Tax=Penicillium brasilianum TaxID=104259 RepID=A0A0F7TJN4_PENBI|nr:hypothetical protein PMG11_01924 [Penicillium brasilianum]
MSGHDEPPERPLQCPSIFKNIEDVPLQDIISAITSDLFSIPLGSHKALHFLAEELRKENAHPLVKIAIDTALKSASLRSRIQVEWKLYHDYEHAKSHLPMDENAPYDLASRCIENCRSCFDLLLRQTVKPSSICQNGHSFFYIALRNNNRDLTQRLVSSMEPKDLLNPFSMKYQMTIFQMSTMSQKLFQLCWTRLKNSPNNGLDTLGSAELGSICRFTDKGLADELSDKGLDLGKPRPENASPGWLEIVRRVDPEQMLEWLLSRGHEPPGKLLTYVATYNLVEATSWLMRHDTYCQDWREAAFVAAESTDKRSVQILSNILQMSAKNWREDQILSQNLVIQIVDRACQEQKRYDKIPSDEHSRTFSRTYIAKVDEVAARKIHALVDKGIRNIQVLGTKIEAEIAGLHELSKALEIMDTQS